VWEEEPKNKKKRKKKKKQTSSKGPTIGTGKKLQDNESNSGFEKKKKKGAEAEYFVEDLGSLSGQSLYWTENAKEDEKVQKAIQTSKILEKNVKEYAYCANRMLDVMFAVADRLSKQEDSVWPILSNAFWISVMQAELLLNIKNTEYLRGIDLGTDGKIFFFLLERKKEVVLLLRIKDQQNQ
jgi:hypothetical protein